MYRNKINYHKTRFCALSWLIAKIILRFTVGKTSKKKEGKPSRRWENCAESGLRKWD